MADKSFAGELFFSLSAACYCFFEVVSIVSSVSWNAVMLPSYCWTTTTSYKVIKHGPLQYSSAVPRLWHVKRKKEIDLTLIKMKPGHADQW